jgi:hypothetical protein
MPDMEPSDAERAHLREMVELDKETIYQMRVREWETRTLRRRMFHWLLRIPPPARRELAIEPPPHGDTGPPPSGVREPLGPRNPRPSSATALPIPPGDDPAGTLG